jgi:CDP-2,3-bis-(O-geranylgeranyl)-sn-glycerol synthase
MPRNNELNDVEIKQKKIALGLALFFACLLLIDFVLISLIYSWSDWIAILIFSLLFIVPGYISNAGMVITGRRGKPIDSGRFWRDGKRIFGSHKTWQGLIFGPLYIGIPISIGIFVLFLVLWPGIEEIVNQVQFVLYNIMIFRYYFIGGIFPIGFLSLIVRIVLCSYGAAIGDLIGAFFKRRLNIESGAPFWVVDQLDFAIVATIFTCMPAIFMPEIFWIPDIFIIIFLIIITPSVSVIANTVAYMTGLKKVPW